jgi:hypothetical protein
MLTCGTFRDSRGSVLLVAAMFAALIGLTLATLINLGNNSLKMASRSFYANSAMNLAETGLELAVACINQPSGTAPAVAWDGWARDDSTGTFTPSATRIFTGFDVGPSATGSIKVWVHHYAGGTGVTPKIVAEATITQFDAPAITKTIEVTLTKRALLGDGISAIEDVTVNGGNLQGRSWNSDPDNSDATPPEAYPGTLGETANITVGSVSGDIDLGGGEIWGYAKVSEGNDLERGIVHGLSSTQDDPDRRSYDFDAQFPTPDAPSAAMIEMTSSVTSTKTFPRAGDLPTTVGGKEIFYYKFDGSENLRFTNDETLTITAGKNVVFVMTNHESNAQGAITITGTAAGIYIESGATFNIYTNGDVNIAGTGVANANTDTKSFMVWGTETVTAGSQQIGIKGSGSLVGVVYAPGAEVTINGGGSMYGAVVGRSVTFTGTTAFYYDEALAGLTLGNPYGASKWKELQSASERAVYATVLNF